MSVDSDIFHRICAKLAEYGLDEEIDLMDEYAVADLLNEPWMKQPKALTNRSEL